MLGGTIEFGETGAVALRRELAEELGVDCRVGRLFATLENVFTYEGERCHELGLIFECSLDDDRVASLGEWEAEETTRDGGITHRLAWKRLEAFRTGGEILYPEGLLPLLGER